MGGGGGVGKLKRKCRRGNISTGSPVSKLPRRRRMKPWTGGGISCSSTPSPL